MGENGVHWNTGGRARSEKHGPAHAPHLRAWACWPWPFRVRMRRAVFPPLALGLLRPHPVPNVVASARTDVRQSPDIGLLAWGCTGGTPIDASGAVRVVCS